MRRKWPAKKLYQDLERKTTKELGLDDLNKMRITDARKFDDPKLLQFPDLFADEVIKMDEVYNYATFHTTFQAQIPKNDPHVFYKIRSLTWRTLKLPE